MIFLHIQFHNLAEKDGTILSYMWYRWLSGQHIWLTPLGLGVRFPKLRCINEKPRLTEMMMYPASMQLLSLISGY